MAARLAPSRFPSRITVGELYSHHSRLSGSSPLRSSPSNFSMSRSPNRWLPPPEPDKPPIPYKTGCQFRARRVIAPPPFLGRYARVPTGIFSDFLNKARFPDEDYLRATTLVDYCLLAASEPLPCDLLEESATFEVLQELAVGDGVGRGRGSQVFTCSRRGHEEPLVAKVYDPLYYPFPDDDFPELPSDVVALAEHDFALESAAYTYLDTGLGGKLVPKFYGSWLLELPLKHLNRPVGFILMEHLRGVPLNTLDPKLYSEQERLRLLALCLEAGVEVRFAGVMHNDMAPRNIICSGTNFLAKDFRLRIIDFNSATIFPLLGLHCPFESQHLPDSPVETFWNFGPVEMRAWLPEAWGRREWNQWLKETWAGSPRFKPVPEHLLQEEEGVER